MLDRFSLIFIFCMVMAIMASCLAMIVFYVLPAERPEEKWESQKFETITLEDRGGFQTATIHCEKWSTVETTVDKIRITVQSEEKKGNVLPKCILRHNNHTVELWLSPSDFQAIGARIYHDDKSEPEELTGEAALSRFGLYQPPGATAPKPDGLIELRDHLLKMQAN